MASVSAERAAAFGGSLAEGEREDAGQQPPGGGGQHPGQPAGPPQGDRRVAGEQRAVQAGQPGVMGTNRPAVAIQPGTASSGRAPALSSGPSSSVTPMNSGSSMRIWTRSAQACSSPLRTSLPTMRTAGTTGAAMLVMPPALRGPAAGRPLPGPARPGALTAAADRATAPRPAA